MSTFNLRNFVKTAAPIGGPIAPAPKVSPVIAPKPVVRPVAPAVSKPAVRPAPPQVEDQEFDEPTEGGETEAESLMREEMTEWALTNEAAIKAGKPPQIDPLWRDDEADGIDFRTSPRSIFQEVIMQLLRGTLNQPSAAPSAAQPQALPVDESLNGGSDTSDVDTLFNFPPVVNKDKGPRDLRALTHQTPYAKKFSELFGKDILNDNTLRANKAQIGTENSDSLRDPINDGMLAAWGPSQKGDVKTNDYGIGFFGKSRGWKYLPDNMKQDLAVAANMDIPTIESIIMNKKSGLDGQKLGAVVRKVLGGKYGAQLGQQLVHMMNFAANRNPADVQAAVKAVPILASMNPEEVAKDLKVYTKNFIYRRLRDAQKSEFARNQSGALAGLYSGDKAVMDAGQRSKTGIERADDPVEAGIGKLQLELPKLADQVLDLSREIALFYKYTPNTGPVGQDAISQMPPSYKKKLPLGKDKNPMMPKYPASKGDEFEVGNKGKMWPEGKPSYFRNPSREMKSNQILAYAKAIHDYLTQLAQPKPEHEAVLRKIYIDESKVQPKKESPNAAPLTPDPSKPEFSPDPNIIQSPAPAPRSTYGDDPDTLKALHQDPKYKSDLEQWNAWHNSPLLKSQYQSLPLRRVVTNDAFKQQLEKKMKNNKPVYAVRHEMTQYFTQWGPYLLLDDVRKRYSPAAIILMTDILPIKQDAARGENANASKSMYLYNAIRGKFQDSTRQHGPFGKEETMEMPGALDYVQKAKAWAAKNHALPHLRKRWERQDQKLKGLQAMRNRMALLKLSSDALSIIDQMILVAEADLKNTENMLTHFLTR